MKINGMTGMVSAFVGLMLMLGGAWAYVDGNFVRAGDFQRVEKSVEDIRISAIDREIWNLQLKLRDDSLPPGARTFIESRINDLQIQRRNIIR